MIRDEGNNEWRSLLKSAGGKKWKSRVRFHREVATFLLLLPPAPRTTQVSRRDKEKARAGLADHDTRGKFEGYFFDERMLLLDTMVRGAKYLENYNY